jgi:hypothetical protein
MTNFSLENLNEIIDDVLLEFCVTYPIPDFQNEEQLLHLKTILEQFGVTILDDAELMEAISLAPKKFTLEAPIKNKAVNPKDKVRVDAHKKGLEGKGGKAYGPKGKDLITHRNQNGKLVVVNPPVKIGKAAQQQKVAAQQKKVVAPTKKVVAPTKKAAAPTKKVVAPTKKVVAPAPKDAATPDVNKAMTQSSFLKGKAQLNREQKKQLLSLMEDINAFYKTNNPNQKEKIANRMIEKYELSASDNKQKCYIGIFSHNQQARKMLGETPGGFASKLVKDIEAATGNELGEVSPMQRLTTAAKPNLTDKSKASTDPFVAQLFNTEPLSYLEQKFYELHGPLNSKGQLIGPSGGKNAKEYFLHSIKKNKSLENTIVVARQLESQGVIKKGLSAAVLTHKREMERIAKEMKIPSKGAAQMVGNSYAKLAEVLAASTDEATTGAIMKQFAEMALYDTEIAAGDECYLPSAGNFPSGDKIRISRKGTKIEHVASVSVKYGLKNGFYGFPGEAAQYQNYHPNPKYRERLNSHPGTPGYSLGVADNLIDNEKEFAKLLKESGLAKTLKKPTDVTKLHIILKKAKKAVDNLRKSVGAESFVDMLPYLKADEKNKKKVTLESINNAFGPELEKLFDKDKLIKMIGPDNAEVILKGPLATATLMTFASTLNTSDGLSSIEHNHQDIKDGHYHSRTDTGSPDIRLWKLAFRAYDKRGGGLIASFNSDRAQPGYFEKKKKGSKK